MNPRIVRILTAILTVAVCTAPALAGDMIGGKAARATVAAPGDMIGGLTRSLGYFASLIASAF